MMLHELARIHVTNDNTRDRRRDRQRYRLCARQLRAAHRERERAERAIAEIRSSRLC